MSQKRAVTRVPSWVPWAALVVLAAAYLGAVAREDERLSVSPPGGWSPGTLLARILVEGLPAALVVFALGLVIAVVQQETREGAMTPRVRRLLFWTPRVATLLFAAFVGLFALDVFGAGYDLWGTLLALLLHLLPGFGLLAAVAVAWRWPWVGAAALAGWAAWYVATFRAFVLSVYVGLALLPLLLGVLFLLDWLFRSELRAGDGASDGRASLASERSGAWPVAGDVFTGLGRNAPPERRHPNRGFSLMCRSLAGPILHLPRSTCSTSSAGEGGGR
jgi:hypothetical protein